MTPEIIARDEFIVVGIRTVLDLSEDTAGELWKDKFLPRRAELGAGKSRCFGVFSVLSDDEIDGRCEYVAGAATDSLEDIPVGMVGWVVPAGTYAEAEACGLGCISPTCREVIADWLPDSGYKLVSGPMFAYTDAARPDVEDALWKVNIPIETPEILAQLENLLD